MDVSNVVLLPVIDSMRILMMSITRIKAGLAAFKIASGGASPLPD